MKPYGGFFLTHRELCSRMHVSVWTLTQMTLLLCLMVLSGPAVSSPLGLEEVFFSPEDRTVRAGGGVFFQCVSGESSAPARITWFKDETLVTRGRQIQGEYGGGSQRKTSGTLHLFNLTLEDDGMYVCVTYNPSLNISRRSRPARLTVQGVPQGLQIIQGPENITVATGTEVYMHCAVRGFPVPMVHWFKDSVLLTNRSSSFNLQNNGQLLTFRNVSREDEGSYHCEASNQRERIRSQTGVLLPAEMDWSFVEQPTNQTVKRGDNVTVTCRPPYSRPAAQVSWFRNNKLLSPVNPVSVLPSGDLFFHSVQEHDSGSYFCRASNLHLQRFLTSRRAALTVLAAPSVKVSPQVLTVPVGSRVVLECEVQGQPPPSVSWVKRGHSKQTGGRISSGLRNATLYIQSARSYDEGVYVCEASNTLGKSQGAATLRVAVSPIIVTVGAQVSCRVGAPVVLPCRAVGILPVTYSWSRGRADAQSAVVDTKGRRVDEEGALHISNVQLSDAGDYYCTAENRAGRHRRRFVLSVTAEPRPADRGEQTGPGLSASNNFSKDPAAPPPTDSVDQKDLNKTQHPHVSAQNEEATCSSSNCDASSNRASTFSSLRGAVAELKMSPSLERYLQRQRSKPTAHQMQPPLLPPPPHPNFQSLDLTEPPITEHCASATNEEVIGTTQASDLPTMPSFSAPLGLLDSKLVSSQSLLKQTETFDAGLVSPSLAAYVDFHWTPTQSYVLVTEGQFLQTYQETASAHTSQTDSPTITESTTRSQEPHVHSTPSPERLKPTSAASELSQTQSPDLQTQTMISSVQSPDQTSEPPPLDAETPVVHQVNTSGRGENETKLTEWLKRNTSQSPMTSNDPRVTQEAPSWLPVLEKHDVPIVVGVGVSLAFIFITVTFYSVVHKNEPVPTSRAAQRNLGVPVRHAERRAAGRTYENRAFEDDDCVAVIEQSPNTSDTRAQPPGPSLVTVQMEPRFEDVQEDTPPALDNHSVTVETYPEPVHDTKVDPFLEEEKVRSLSQPSIQLQCAEDWTSHRGDNHSPCQDALPPPSSLPSRSPSPSPPSRPEAGLRSSLTLQSAESHGAPIHHSLSISHGNPPLLLSHHVSLGLTTVAVDVHFFPAATASMAGGPQVNSASNSASAAAPTLANGQESEQSTARFK